MEDAMDEPIYVVTPFFYVIFLATVFAFWILALINAMRTDRMGWLVVMLIFPPLMLAYWPLAYESPSKRRSALGPTRRARTDS